MILDVDGTLVDSNDAHARSWVEAFADYGITVAYDATELKADEVYADAASLLRRYGNSIFARQRQRPAAPR